MSKWTTSYNSSPFHTTLKQYKEAIDNYDSAAITDTDTLAELARLKKVLAHSETLLSLIDPELNADNAITTSASNLNNSHSAFKTYTGSANIGHIQQANSHLDTCVNNLKILHIPLSATPKKSVAAMITGYQKVIEKALTQIDLSAVKNASQEIKDLKELLIDADDSIQLSIESSKQKIDEHEKEIAATHQWIMTGTETDTSVKADIKAALAEITSANNNATDASKELKKLRTFYEEVYGVTVPDPNDDTKTIIKKNGLQQTLNQRLKNLTKLEESHEAKYSALVDQITGLLPDATSAGLAHSFQVERNKFSTPKKNWNKLFIGSLITMFVITALSLFQISVEPLSISFSQSSDWKDAFNQILHRLPLYGPLIWLAIYAGRRHNEQQRLEQEYAHKEAFAKAYSSYKDQIELLEDTDQKLITDLLGASIETLAYNASETLDKRQRDDTPLNEFVKILPDLKTVIDKISKK